jgi:hypothetical protein
MTSERITQICTKIRPVGDISPWAFLVPATLISFLFSGYIPLTNNNIYHIHILLQNYDLTQFSDDPFVQSLRNFSSGFWILFAGAGRYINVKVFLGIWLFITHLAFLAAGLHFAQSLGQRENRQLNLFLLLLCCSPMAVKYTVGGGGLMIDYFTHSELANATLLFGFSVALRGRYGWSAVAVCVTFFLNAFMAVWMLPSLVLLAAYQLYSSRISARRFLADGAIGLVIGSVFLIAPVLNILDNPEVSGSGGFSYQGFLWAFYPDHFFFSSLSINKLVFVAASIITLFLTISHHGRQSGGLLMLSIGAVVLLIIAAIVPIFTDSRLILNLHLVRGFLVIAMLTTVSLAIVASRWVTAPTSSYLAPLGLVLFGGLLASKYGIILAGILLILEYFFRYNKIFAIVIRWNLTKIVAWIFLVACVAILPIRSQATLSDSWKQTRLSWAWERVGVWADRSTSAGTVFQVAQDGAPSFSFTSNRKIWFDYKYGAAVMWSPSYYEIWKDRSRIKNKDVSNSELMASYRERNIDYLANYCDESVSEKPQYQQDGICVYKLR